MGIHRTLLTGLAFSLHSLLVACGGGGGGSDSASNTPPPPVPTAQCFADYDSQQERWDAYRSSKGRVVYSGNNGRSISSVNLASGDITSISNSLPSGARAPQLSSSGRYIVLPTGSITAPVFDQEEGRVRNELVLAAVGPGKVNWAPDDSALLVEHILGAQLYSGLPSANLDLLQLPQVPGLAWSPDGDWLATVDDEKLSIYALSPLRLFRTMRLEPGAPRPGKLGFDPTGKYLAYTTTHVPEGADHWQRDIHLLNLATLDSSVIYSTSDVGGLSPDYAWSPSGRFIALVGFDDENDFSLRRYSLDSRSTRVIEGAERKLSKFIERQAVMTYCFSDTTVVRKPIRYIC